MSVILQCLKKEVVKFAIRRSLVKMALGDSIEEREICGRVFFGGSLPANTVSARYAVVLELGLTITLLDMGVS